MKFKFKYLLICVTTLLWSVALSLVFSLALGASSKREEPTSSPASRTEVGQGSYNVLILGTDDTSSLTDVIMIASYDEAAQSVNIVQIPRDTYAEYSDGSYRKLNGAKNRLGGERALCDFLSSTLCIEIDHYISLDLDAIEEIVDALGGVELDIPFDMDYDDPAQDLHIHLKAGNRLLSGKEARQFVRYRSGYLRGDVGRIDAQKLFLASLVKKFKNDASAIDTASIVFKISDDLRTDMPISDMLRLAKSASLVSSERINFITLAGEEAVAKKSGASYYVISRTAAIEIVNRYLGGKASEDNFDEERKLLNDDYSEFSRIYFSYAKYSVSDAASICENGIDIQRKR